MLSLYLPIGIFILLSICIIFFYLTALAGVKFYETRLQRDDVKNIKILIHLFMTLTTMLMSFIFYAYHEGIINVSDVKKIPDTEKNTEMEIEKPTE